MKLNVNQLFEKLLICILLAKSVAIPNETSAQENNFPDELKKMDYVLLPLGLALQIIGDNRIDNPGTISIEKIADLNRNDVNAFDRSATHIFSGAADNISDQTRTSLVIIPSLIIGHQLIQKEWKNAVNYGVMQYEAY